MKRTWERPALRRPSASALRLVAAAAAVFAVGVGGVACGGDDDAGTIPALDRDPQATAKTKRKRGEARSQGRRQATAPEQSQRGERGRSGEGKKIKNPADVRRAIRKVPTDDLELFADEATLAVVRSLGYPEAEVALSGDRKLLRVTIPRSFACGARPGDAAGIAGAVQNVVIFASKVAVFAGDAGPIEAYVESCPPLSPPSPGGSPAYSLSGVGARTSDEVKIKSKRWTVSYVNGGGPLEINIGDGSTKLKPTVRSSKREAGRQVYAGPGTFRVSMASRGQWELRIYDGA